MTEATTSASGWPAAPPRPELGAGDVHVWRAHLDAASLPATLLTAPELARAERIAGAQERRRWTLSRGILRSLLSTYLGVEPSAVTLALTPLGKPVLSDGRAAPVPRRGRRQEESDARLHFNLSHSGADALYAFARRCPVGVDLETRRRVRRPAELAQRLLGEGEARRIAALAPADQERAFLRSWVRHEAELKCLGTGLAHADVEARGRVAWVRELDLGDDAAGAVAVLRPPASALCWEWPGAGSPWQLTRCAPRARR